MRSWQDCEDPYSEAEWRQSRLDELHELDARAGSEALRMHLAKELYHCHFEMLERSRFGAARGHLDELRELVARHVEETSPSRIVKTQWLWFARALVDAMEHQAQLPRAEACVSLLAELLLARRRASDAEGMDEAWCAGLEHAGAVCLAEGDVAARDLVAAMRSDADRTSPTQTLRLARMLQRAHEAAMRRGDAIGAAGYLAELRGLAELTIAEGYARAALTEALARAHSLGSSGQRPALLAELRRWASRHDATQEQREHYWRALAETAETHDQPLPDELVRERAYRSADPESAEALFERIEARARSTHGLLDFIGVAAELRDLAERPGAPPELRLRFAKVWLETALPLQPGSSQAALDRVAYRWALDAARAGDPTAAVLVGHCHRQGRGASLSLRRARRWYLEAAQAGEEQGDQWLRAAVPWSQRRLFVLARFPELLWLGGVLLVVELVRNPPTVNALGLFAYLALLSLGQFFVKHVLDRARPPQREQTGGSRPPEGHWWDWLRAALGVAREDGLFVVPVIWLGSPWAAVLSGIAFGAAHYPGYPWRWCAAKAVVFAVALLFILPWGGLGTMLLGHVLFDVLVWAAFIRYRRAKET